jgi:drug/metabolite transporter (DMT)-like permease
MISGREKLLAYGSWVAVCVLWGTTYLAIRVGLETLPPMLFAGMRFLTAGMVLLLIVRWWSGARLPRGREWVDQALIGLLLLGVGNGFVVWAEQSVPSGLAALLVATSPFWITGFERLRREGERSNRRGMLGMLVGFAGLILLVGPGLFDAAAGRGFLLGVVLLQVACAAWSGGSVYAKHHQTRLAPLMGASIQMLVAGLALSLLGSVLGEWRAVSFSARSLSALLYLILFGSIVAYGSYNYAIQKLPLSLVTMYSYINPVIAVLLGWAILNEALGWRVLTAMGIILGGVGLVKSAPTAGAKVSEGKAGEASEDERQAELDILSAGQKSCSASTP